MIRTARAKEPKLRTQLLQYARLEMDKHVHIERRNVMLVEHYLRKGKKQLEIIEQGSVQVSAIRSEIGQPTLLRMIED